MRPGFELDHIGIAVPSIADALPFYKTLGWTEFQTEDVPTEKVRVAFIAFENRVNIELLEPSTPESVIAKFISKKGGGGIHHICYRVKNIEAVISQLLKDGVRMIDTKPRPGAHGCRVAFVHPQAAGGVLVELSERPQKE